MKIHLSIILCWILGGISLANANQATTELPPIETYVTEPTVIENINIWVPAARSGPFINRSCSIKENLIFSSVLPASVNHQKTAACLNSIAKRLAKMTNFYHAQSLPLTIFNGWQWEYSYSLSQFESMSYNLKQRGGTWENVWEAILSFTYGLTQIQAIELTSPYHFDIKKQPPSNSTIEIKTFSSMRTRDGYPKERQL